MLLFPSADPLLSSVGDRTNGLSAATPVEPRSTSGEAGLRRGFSSARKEASMVSAAPSLFFVSFFTALFAGLRARS